jgi:predicted AlkP superfamily pyrophosphatase or phosphodiesterase
MKWPKYTTVIGTLVLFLMLPLTSSATGTSVKPYTLVISIDGFPYNTFEKWRQKAPVLNALAKSGVYGPSRTIFPSMTWPSHASIITGVYPAKHGVLGNRKLDRRRKRPVHYKTVSYGDAFKVKTIFDLAHDAGMTSAAILWPNADRAGDAITWAIPEVYSNKAFAKGSSKGFMKALKAKGYPSHHLGKFSKRQMFLQDSMARDIAIHLVETKQPKMNFVHFLSMDTFGHGYGPNSPEVGWGMELVDRYIGQIFAAYKRVGLYKKTNIMIVSDHGFLKITRRIDGDRILHNANLIRNLKKLNRGPVRTVGNGHALFIYIYDWKKRRALRKEIAALFRPIPGVERVYFPSQFKKVGLPHPKNNVDAPDLVILSKPHSAFSRVSKKRETARGGGYGMHGYLPKHPDMWPLFIASGPNIRKLNDPVKGMSNLHIAPTLAKILGLKFPADVPLDGKVRADILR